MSDTSPGSPAAADMSDPRDVVVARPWLSEILDRWLTSRQRALHLVGSPGIGKSTQLSAFHQQHRSSFDLVHFECRRNQRPIVEARRFARTVANGMPSRVRADDPPDRLAARVHVDTIDIDVHRAESSNVTAITYTEVANGPLDPIATVESFIGQLRDRPRGDSASVVVVLDGLDESSRGGGETVHDVLAALAGGPLWLRFIVSSKPDARLAGQLANIFSDLQVIDLDSHVYALNHADDVERYLDALMEQPSAASTLEQDRHQIAQLAVGNLLCAKAFAVESIQGRMLDVRRGASDIARYVTGLLDQLVRPNGHDDGWQERWQDLEAILGLLAVAREPLDFDLLVQWSQRSGESVRSSLDQLRPLLEIVADNQSVAVIHPQFARALISQLTTTGPYHVGRHEALLRILRYYTASDFEGDAGYGARHCLYHALELYEVEQATLVTLRELATDTEAFLPRATQVGRSSADLVACLSQTLRIFAEQRDGTSWDTLSRFLANSAAPAMRAIAVRELVLTTDHAELAEMRSTLLEDLSSSSGSSPTFRVALEAAMRSGMHGATSHLRHIIKHGTANDRRSAGRQVYLHFASDPSGLMSDVLMHLAADVSLIRPWRSRRTSEFLAHAAITAYMVHCDNPLLAENATRLCARVLRDRLHLHRMKPLQALARSVVSRLAADPIAGRVMDGLDSISSTPQPSYLEMNDESWRRLVRGLGGAVPPSAIIVDLSAAFDADSVVMRLLAAETVAAHAMQVESAAGDLLGELAAACQPRGRTWLLLSLSVISRTTPSSWTAPLEALTTSVIMDDRECFESHCYGDLQQYDLMFVPLALTYAKHGTPMRLLQDHANDHPADATRVAHGIGIAGLFFPNGALAAIRQMKVDGVAASAVAEGLALMKSLYPEQIEETCVQLSCLAETLEAEAALRDGLADDYIELLGLYNNSVFSAVRYPLMRDRLVLSFYEAMLGSKSVSTATGRYARAALDALAVVDYDPQRWLVANAVDE